MAVRYNKSGFTHGFVFAGIILLCFGFVVFVECNFSLDVPSSPVLVWDGKTVAEVTLHHSGHMMHCKLHELEEVTDATPLIQNSGLEVRYPSFRSMLELINNCTRLEKPAPGTELLTPHNITEPSTWLTWPIWNGIMPGTKWCGVGDIAESFDELGSEIDLDACCRAHDHCPVKLKAFRAGYGLINLSLYTRSHCECDRHFFNCLKKAKNPTADMVGNFYFNVLQVRCLEDNGPYICTVNRTQNEDHLCTNWAEDTSRNNMKVTSTELKY